MSDEHLSTLLDVAVEAARAAGRHAAENGSRRGEAIARSEHDIKLKLDVECQAKAEAVIRAHCPGDSIIGEEDALRGEMPREESERQWILDPIDGTVNFSHGMPNWACSVAVRSGDMLLAGAVYSPVLDRLYTATIDTPALCNGTQIQVSTVDRLDEAIVLTGIDKSPDPAVPPLTSFRNIALAVQRPRVMGCASLDICAVAEGRGDAYYESGIFIWDVAAAGLIVERAGGAIEHLGPWSGDSLRFLASNGRLHEALRAIVEPTDAA